MKEIQIFNINKILQKYRNETLTYETIRKIIEELEDMRMKDNLILC